MRLIATLFTLLVWAFAAFAPAAAQIAPAEPGADAFKVTTESRPPPAAPTQEEPDVTLSAPVRADSLAPVAASAEIGLAGQSARAPDFVAPPEPEPALKSDELAGAPLPAPPPHGKGGSDAIIVPGDVKGREMPAGPVNIVIDNWYCYDSAGGLPQAGELGRIIVLWPCDGSDRQAFILEDGVLYAGPDHAAQVLVDVKPWYPGCFDRNNYSEKRFYTFGACADQDDGEFSFEVDLTDPGRAVMHAHMPRTLDAPARGRPVIIAPTSVERPPRAQWEYLEARKLIRLIGTNLCITPPYGDQTRGAVLTLDDCDEPVMGLSGETGPSDGRARVDVLRRTWVRR